MNTIIKSVFKFNKEVVGIGDRNLHALQDGEARWMHQALTEEANELKDANTVLQFFTELPVDSAIDVLTRVIVAEVDACVDSVIFAIGGLARMGLTEDQVHACMEAVMAANFDKKAGVKAERSGTGTADAIKPEGWVGPETRIKEILFNGK